MNNVKQLRLERGIQQKELALEIGVSSAAVSDWESGKKNPTGERLEKLAEYFGVDKATILGKSFREETAALFVPQDPLISGVSQTEQIVQHVLERLSDLQPKTPESVALVKGVDKLSKDKRQQLLNVAKAMFSEVFDEETQNDSRL